jgi:ketosteroid isomerase-like protein
VEDLKSMLNSAARSLENEVKRLEAKVDALMKLPDRIEIENLPKTMAWGMDSGDRDLWLSVWSDDIRYIVPQYDIEINGTEALAEFGEAVIFTREERRFSALTNIMVDVKGDTATGRDYYMHYGYPIDPETGKASEERDFSEGMHFYEFAKRDGVWKITKFEVHLNRRQEAEA